jgi:hypothetical protein
MLEKSILFLPGKKKYHRNIFYDTGNLIRITGTLLQILKYNNIVISLFKNTTIFIAG